MPKVQPKKPVKPAKPVKKAKRPDYLYPEVSAVVRVGDNAVTAEEMKKILGWEAESEQVQFGDLYLFRDLNGVKVRLRNNDSNRPLDLSWALELAHNYVRRNWADSRNGDDMSVNGETFVIDRNGIVRSGQHRGIGLVLAEQLLNGPNGGQFEDLWPDGIMSAEFIIAYGISDNPAVTSTLDNVKPRTLKDVLFADHHLFSHLDHRQRVQTARIAEYAIRLLRGRTRADKNGHKPKRIHTEHIKTLNAHPRLKDAVLVMHEEAAGNPQFKRIMMPGTAAGFLYLMGCALSDGDAYMNAMRQGIPYSEDNLDWSLWDDAVKFWRGLFVTNNQMPPHAHEIRKAIAACASRGGAAEATNDEKTAIILKAWNLYAAGKDVTAKELKLRYQRKEDYALLIDFPVVGGIDQGVDRTDEIGDAGTADVGTAPVEDEDPETMDDLIEQEQEDQDEDEPAEMSAEELEAAKAEARKASEQAEALKRQQMRDKLLASRAKRKPVEDPRLDAELEG